ncbi:hypothetical protein GCK72_009225 [Caenorhabditis remanei]|uniref:RNA helicase n=1 Tax=Caenorhabditis remanei TaxID=31234 RepID=A0A6A5H3B8_CAERE|nr:hypothetical protein GCK72_009225 [Caenorhabditis remanei]KAF1760972.1 hypothetical protein GCK72_009225 [Caenorhabditis remanei]
MGKRKTKHDDAADEYDANELMIVPGEKRKKIEKTGEKSATGGKKNRNFTKEKEEAKLTKQAKRKLAAVHARKALKQTQEELFAGLAECQLDPSKLNQLTSSTKISRETEKKPNFPEKLKVFSGKAKSEEKRTQQNYYPTDDESTDSEEEEDSEDVTTPEVAISEVKVEPIDLDDEEDVQVTSEVKKTSSDVVVKREDDEESDNEDILALPTTTVINRKKVLVERSEDIQKSRAELPIFAEEMRIVEAINENLVTVVCGETGSGKTTQIPQFLYEAGYASEGELIGITEPRRVAAIAMAQRVGIELGKPENVSYQIRYEGTRSDDTNILFMTDGVLMKEMEQDVMLKKYSVILIDEAHERSMYSDVLIGMLSRIVPLRAKTARPLRLVIMSATLRLDDFTHKKLFPLLTPKVIKVDARQFPVTVHFEKRTPDDYISSAFRKTCRIHETLPPGAILVFVTGQNEVRQLIAKLKKRYPVVYETDKNGQVLVKGTKEWKEKKAEAAKNIKLEDFKEETPEKDELDTDDVLDADDINERGAAEAFDDYEELENGDGDLNDGAVENTIGAPPANCEPLYCLPLYSLLSMGKQRRVFDETPAGMRLCVISTNVAETSLTIPGVKYVIDGGFEKRRLYDSITGVSRFAVCRISQASADQRAGRAGRISAGHAYRLYSSAVYQDCVKFADPEILSKPADQLVLHLKSMNIVKVVNFPFPSAPDEQMLEAAEKRLCRLGALSETTVNGKTVARITKLGKTLAVFPLAPSYAKFIAMADQHDLMNHAILLISLLSVREPLIPVSSLRGATPEETKELMKNVLKERRRWCTQTGARRLGDLKVLMHAATVAESVKYNARECEKVGLRVKALVEARKLRQQLTNIVNASCKKEQVAMLDAHLPPPTEQQSQLLRQMVVASFSDRLARRVDRSVGQEEVQKGAYETTLITEHVFIDPCSVLFTEEPEFVIYQELVQVNEKKLMTSVCAVDKEWISRLAESYCKFGESSDKNLEPIYDGVKDAVCKNVKVTFGPLDWKLPNENRKVPHDIMQYRYFALFLLDGQVFEKLKEFTPKLLAPPTTMVKSWAKLQKRTEMLLNKLVDKEVTNRATLKEQWLKNENWLLEEYLEWVPESLHQSISLMWPPLEEDEKTAKMGRNKKY